MKRPSAVVVSTRLCLAMLLGVVATHARADNAGVTLIEAGEPRARIIVPDDQDREAYEALAAELNEHFRLMAGASLPVIFGHAAEEGTTVRLGTASDASWLDRLPADASPASFVIAIEPGEIALVGKTPEGTANAVYALLERLGVRWFMPGDLGRVVPTAPTLTLRPGVRVEVPSFRHRALQDVHPDLAWARRNRLSAESFAKGGHGFPGSKGRSERRELFQRHPEWFALIDGERQMRQMCVSNRDLLDYTVEHTLAYFESNPAETALGIGPNDGYGYCECDDCRAMDSGRISPWNGQRHFTDRYIKFINQVIERVEPEYPDKTYQFYAYQSHILPPTIPPHPAITPFIAPINLDRIHGISNPHSLDRAAYGKLMQGWSDYGLTLYERGYYFNLAVPAVPFSKVHALRELIPLTRDLGFAGHRPEVKATWPSNGPTLYVAAKLFWDAEADVEAILEDYAEKFFGPASSPMRRYLEAVDHAYRDAPTMVGGSASIPGIFSRADADALRGLLEQAEAAASGRSPYDKRVAMFRETFDALDAYLDMFHARNALDFAASMAAYQRGQTIIDEQTSTYLAPRPKSELPGHRLLAAEMQAPLMTPRALPKYLRRFWHDELTAGLDRTKTKGRLLVALPDAWAFLLDPTDAGEWGAWYRDGEMAGNWQPMPTFSSSWSDQGLHYYKGVAWYRSGFTLTDADHPERGPIYLWLGGVDEQARVWVNGQYIGSSEAPGEGIPGTPKAFQPVDFDITDAVRRAGANTVAIRVVNDFQNELGTGGLVAPVMVWTPLDPNDDPARPGAGEQAD